MPNPQKPPPSFPLWWLWIALLALSLFGVFAGGRQARYQPIPYSEFQTLLDQNKVKQVVVSGDTIQGQLTEPVPGTNTPDSPQRRFRRRSPLSLLNTTSSSP